MTADILRVLIPAFTSRSFRLRIIRSLVVAVASVLSGINATEAATFTWSGAGSIAPFNNNNWANLFNWAGSAIPVNDGTADIVIPDTPRDNPVVDLPWSIDTLQFQGPANLSLNGQPLTIAGDLTNSSTGTTTINNTLDVPSSGAVTTWRAANGPIVFNGAITGGKINFFLEAPQPITFDGTALNTFANDIIVREGTLILSKPATNGAIVANLAIGNSSGSAVTVQWDNSEQISQAAGVTVSVRTTGTADLNSKLETLDSLLVEGLLQSSGGKLTILSDLTMGGGEIDMGAGELDVPALVKNSGTNAQGTINGSLLRLANPKTEFRIGDRNQAIETEINAIIADNSAGSSQLVKSFDGVLRLTGANTYSGSTLVQEGTLRADNATGSATGAGFVVVLSTGRLDGDGVISGGVLIASGASFAPGSTIGSLEVGPLTLAAGSQSQFQINGTTQGTTYDFAQVDGAANLDGSLLVTLQNFSVPLGGGQKFTILSASSIVHSFANVANGSRLRTLEGHGSFIVNYGAGSPFNSNEVVLSGFILSGDYNQNGIVDAADYTVWRDSLGKTGVSLAADGNLDQIINSLDYDIWRTNFGQAVVTGSGADSHAAIPEPATWLPIICAGLLLTSSTLGRKERGWLWHRRATRPHPAATLSCTRRRHQLGRRRVRHSIWVQPALASTRQFSRRHRGLAFFSWSLQTVSMNDSPL